MKYKDLENKELVDIIFTFYLLFVFVLFFVYHICIMYYVYAMYNHGGWYPAWYQFDRFGDDAPANI